MSTFSPSSSSTNILAKWTPYNADFLPRVAGYAAKIEAAKMNDMEEGIQTIPSDGKAFSKNKGQATHWRQGDISFYSCQHDRLPAELRYQEGNIAYPTDGTSIFERFSAVHRRYTGSDRPKGKSSFSLQAIRHVTMLIEDRAGNLSWFGDVAPPKGPKTGGQKRSAEDHDQDVLNESQTMSTEPEILIEREDEYKPSWAPKLKVFSDSIQPSVDIGMTLASGTTVHCVIFSDDLTADYHIDGTGFDVFTDALDEGEKSRDSTFSRATSPPPNLNAIFDEEQVAELRLSLKRTRGSRLRFSNISKVELARIKDGKALRERTFEQELRASQVFG